MANERTFLAWFRTGIAVHRARASRRRSSWACNAADGRLVQILAITSILTGGVHRRRRRHALLDGQGPDRGGDVPARPGVDRRDDRRRRSRLAVLAIGVRAAARPHVARSGAGSAPVSLPPMPTFRAPRGTRDLLPEERAVFDRLTRIATGLTTRYGYRPIETPLFEQTAVFERGIGEVTDVVEKELFRIAPRTEEAESWALRPEPTAGIVRAYVQHGMQTLPQPVKLDDDRADVPLRPPAGGPLPPVLAVRRRGDRGPGTGGRRRDHRARAPVLHRGRRRGRRGPRQLDRRPGLPARPTSPSLADYYRGHAERPAADRARPPGAQRPAAARLEGPGDGGAQRRPRRGSPTTCARRARRTSRR